MSTVTRTVEGGVAQVRLNRPEKFNALSLEMMRELVETAAELRRDRSLRAVVIAGEGEAFSAGIDTSAFADVAASMRTFLPNPLRGTNLFQECAWAWRRVPVPVVAVVHGHCYGAGLQVAMAADFRYTTPDARWSVMEARWGLVPDMSGIRSLVQQVGMDTAKRLTMTAEVVSGEEAVRLGLATDASQDPYAAAGDLVEAILTRSPDSVAATKRLFNGLWTASERRTFRRERMEQLRLLMRTPNTKIMQRATRAKEVAQFGPRAR